MKVLMVSRWLWEERRRNGDTPGFFGELARAIAAKGIDLTILSQAADAGAVPEPRPVDGLNVHVFSLEKRSLALAPPDKLIKLWAGYRKAATDAAVIRRFAQQHGPFDAVVAQCEEPDGLACALASRARGFPALVTCVHDLRYDFRPEGVRFVRKSSLGFVFRRSGRVVANSLPTATWLQREYAVPENKIGQCRIHLTAPFLNLAAQPAPSAETDRPRVLFLGALNRKKAPDVFLRAATLLAPDLPDATFVLLGPETSDDRRFHALLHGLAFHRLLAHRLESLGRLEPSAVMDQIRRARVVVCPSRIETFSRATIEALALGRPVVVTETTGAAHWVRSTGCGSVVPPDDPAALARAIRDWTTRENVPGAAARIVSELTASRAADDWIREVTAAVSQPHL
ncbi:MAG TPA: glycosyltransferase family 4 protein [Candidatus Methylacidiphilales bacterium]|jgi:glycosyltransferase involved in cell wall biosynthesis|nr:glycosyltransferase family 4 protein [Candidatus Methylacidiphilales bacterium]